MSGVVDVLASLLLQTRDQEMDCDTFLEWMAASVDGRLPEEQTALFEHHRRICPECEEERAALMRALRLR